MRDEVTSLPPGRTVDGRRPDLPALERQAGGLPSTNFAAVAPNTTSEERYGLNDQVTWFPAWVRDLLAVAGELQRGGTGSRGDHGGRSRPLPPLERRHHSARTVQEGRDPD